MASKKKHVMKGAKLNIDRVFAQIGEFGHQQVRYCLLLAVMNLYAPQFMLQYTFVGHDMPFTCVSKADGASHFKTCPSGGSSHCKDIIFNTNETDSINSEWHLVCDRAWMSPLSMSIFMLGVLIGSIILGSTADRIGRKKTLLISFIML